MRWALLYKPALALERLVYHNRQRKRRRQLKDTPAEHLRIGEIDSLELLQAARLLGIETIYDIGANVGSWTLLAKAIIPAATIEAFEPLPQHNASFRTNLLGVENVSLHSIGLGPANGTGLIRVANFSDASSFLPNTETNRDHFGIDEVEQLSVLVRRLDDYRDEHGLPYPDLIKLDVQGYELEVLKGGTQCLRNAKAVLIEVSFAEYYRGQCFFHDVVSFMANAGLFIGLFGVNTPTGSVLRQTDVLFVRQAVPTGFE